MKILLNVLWISLTLVLAGCGGQSGNSNVTENADQKAKAEYEAMIKAQEEAESAAMKSSKPDKPAQPAKPVS